MITRLLLIAALLAATIFGEGCHRRYDETEATFNAMSQQKDTLNK